MYPMANERLTQTPDSEATTPPVAVSSRIAFARPLWIWPFISGFAVAVAAGCVILLITGVSKVTTYELQTFDEPAVELESPCEADKRALEVAVEAWYADFSDAVDPSQTDLVESGYLPAAIGTYDIRPTGSGVEVDPVVGGECA
jgi:hypothetical protein